jgi:hypothetical protein
MCDEFPAAQLRQFRQRPVETEPVAADAPGGCAEGAELVSVAEEHEHPPHEAGFLVVARHALNLPAATLAHIGDRP